MYAALIPEKTWRVWSPKSSSKRNNLSDFGTASHFNTFATRRSSLAKSSMVISGAIGSTLVSQAVISFPFFAVSAFTLSAKSALVSSITASICFFSKREKSDLNGAMLWANSGEPMLSQRSSVCKKASARSASFGNTGLR